jgi:hypothetical protein
VPPIYEPELAARAVVYAADHPRRKQYWVGSSTVGTLLGQKLAPALLDRYLARTGYDAQQTPEPVPADRRHNLWEPRDAEDDRGAHGIFDAQAHHTDPQQWYSRHAGEATAAVVATGLLAATLLRRRG